jgi:type I restriction enzyme, S subunit
MENSLATGWSYAKIDDCFNEIINGTNTAQNDVEGIPVTRIETIQQSKFNLSRIKFISNPDNSLIEKFKYKIGDIAFSHINSMEHVGKVALYEGKPQQLIHGMNLLRLRLGHNYIVPRYAYYYFLTTKFREDVRIRVGQAVNQVSINQKNLKEIPFVLCPFAEQQRIVAKLDELMEKIDRSRARLERIPKILKRFRQSLLNAAVGGKLTSKFYEDEWTPSDGRQIFEFITSGSRGWAEYYSSLGKLFLRVTNLDYDTININIEPEKNKYVNPPQNAEGVRTRVQPNDILISITGDVGMVGLVDSSVGEAFVNQHICLARPKSGINAKYLAYYISSAVGGRKHFNEVKKGATKFGLGLEDIRTMPIKLPPLSEQQTIVEIIENLFRFADKIEARYNNAKAQLDKLPQSLLAKAFRGELVTQCQNDEPADELLKRIRQQKTLQSKTKGNRAKANGVPELAIAAQPVVKFKRKNV